MRTYEDARRSYENEGAPDPLVYAVRTRKGRILRFADLDAAIGAARREGSQVRDARRPAPGGGLLVVWPVRS